ncbi:MAG: low molecular weight phosphotyrosine protein phosphatase [Mucilaginibacter polytrichastri]|nr:low molecular weight phosphotyrosine protein phosphatase [Mucilaginibacter polytrichastri]
MKILMVCLGNICRSPLAHGVLEHKAREAGLALEVDSAGTGSWHIGDPPDRRSVAVARQYGVDISAQRGRQFSKADFDRYDHILVMDRANLRDVRELAPDSESRAKVTLFLHEQEVPDPYWDDSLFEPTYRLIEKRCNELVARWKSEQSGN